MSQEYKIIKERNNPLIERKEYEVYINHITRGTPSRQEIREAISKLLNVPLENIYVISVKSVYGYGASKALIHVYSDAKRGEEIESEYIKIRNKPKAKSKEG